MNKLSSSRRWQLKYPEKYQAQRKVQNAIQTGKLIRGNCKICNKPNAHAHHEDYSKPLEVTWLCAKCHSNLHNKDRKKHYEINKNPLIPKAIKLREQGMSYGQISKQLSISRSQVYKWIKNPPYK